jgi:hypothetical protein
MVISTPRQLKVGAIIDKTLGVVEYSIAASAIYVVGITIVTAAITYFTLNVTAPLEQLGIGLVKFAVGVSAAYLLLEAMMRRTGLRSPADEDVFLPYLALSILYTLGVFAGFVAIIIPGLVVMARWSIAQPMLLAGGQGVTKALGESWERTRGLEFQIIAAMLALLVVLIAAVIASSVMLDQTGVVGIVVTQLASSAMTVMSLAMRVALYGLIVGGSAERSLTG